jgi:lipoyl-dependent peroxiredoxin
MTAVYTAIATASGRDGRAVTSDGKLDLPLSLPPQLGGDGEGTNPEQLFAAGYAGCFASAMKMIAGTMSIDATAAAVTAEVGLHRDDSGGFTLSANLRVELPDHISPAEADKLLEATHQACPYSKATRGNIPVTLTRE